MSGNMVGVDIEQGKLFYLANIDDPVEACNAVMAATGESNATALTRLEDSVFQWFGTPKGQIQAYHPD
jgi:hypothetical protein